MPGIHNIAMAFANAENSVPRTAGRNSVAVRFLGACPGPYPEASELTGVLVPRYDFERASSHSSLTMIHGQSAAPATVI